MAKLGFEPRSLGSRAHFLIYMLYCPTPVPQLIFPITQVLFIPEKAIMQLTESTLRNCFVSFQEPWWWRSASCLLPNSSPKPKPSTHIAGFIFSHRNHSLDFPGQGRSFSEAHCSQGYDSHAVNNLHRFLCPRWACVGGPTFSWMLLVMTFRGHSWAFDSHVFEFFLALNFVLPAQLGAPSQSREHVWRFSTCPRPNRVPSS